MDYFDVSTYLINECWAPNNNTSRVLKKPCFRKTTLKIIEFHMKIRSKTVFNSLLGAITTVRAGMQP